MRLSSGTAVEDYAAYVRAVVDGDMAFVSGTIGVDPVSKVLPKDAETQARNSIATIAAALDQAGMTLSDVVHCRVYITDIAVLDDVAKVLRESFDKHRPANTTLICGIPAPGALVEIEATARRSSDERTHPAAMRR